MALTYTEIEQQKNRRIWIFFGVVVLFYFIIAVVLATATKVFFAAEVVGKNNLSFLSGEELFYVVLFALAAALIHTAYSIGNAASLVKQSLEAVEIDPSDTPHQRFKNIIDEVNVATGNKCRITPVVIPTVAMNAFTVSNSRREAVLGITEGLLWKLNREQLEAVIAHEVGHIVSGDSYQTTIACSLFGIYAAMLAGIEKTFGEGRVRVSERSGGRATLFLVLVYLLLSLLQFFYNMVRLFVSRDRELRADSIAVRITRDPISLSEALVIISRGWRGLGHIDRNLESLFIVNPVHEEVDESEGFWADLLSTHPPLHKRVSLLTQMAHADVKQIEESVLAQEKQRDQTRDIVTEEEGPQWMVLEKGKGWRGPLTLPQLRHLGWVTPDTWFQGVGEQEVKQAKDAPLLKPCFAGQLEKLNVSSLLCPRCNQSLVWEEYEGAMGQRCVFCGGILLEENKVRRIIIRREKGFDEGIKKFAELTQKSGLEKFHNKELNKPLFYLKCPRCQNNMMRTFYTMAYLVEVDRCLPCDLVWFDRHELEVVQCLIEGVKAV